MVEPICALTFQCTGAVYRFFSVQEPFIDSLIIDEVCYSWASAKIAVHVDPPSSWVGIGLLQGSELTSMVD